jgi:hypothetical protein
MVPWRWESFSARTSGLNHLKLISEVMNPAITIVSTGGRKSFYPTSPLRQAEARSFGPAKMTRFANPAKTVTSLERVVIGTYPYRSR